MPNPPIPSIDPITHQFPDAIRQRSADNIADATSPEGAAVAEVAAAATAGKAPLVSPSSTGVPTVNGQQLAPAATPYPYWRKKLAQVRAGLSDAKILCMGDSTTYGYVAPPNDVPTPAIASYPSDLATILNAYFAPSAVGLAIPQAQSGTSVDGRWVMGSGWSMPGSRGISWARASAFEASGSSGPLTFTPGTSAGVVDTFDVYYIANGINSPFTIQATGGAAVTVSQGTTNGVFKATCTAATAGTGNTVTITTTAAVGTRFIVGAEAYHSANRRIRVGNAGVGGSTSGGWANNSAPSYSSLACIEAYAPDLTIIDLGLNDMAAPNTPAATFEANITALVTSARKSGDVILMVPPPPFIGGSSNITDGYNALIPSYAKLATTLGIGIVDITSRWGSYAALNPLGYYSDTLHPSRIGYGDMAQAASTLIRAI